MISIVKQEIGIVLFSTLFMITIISLLILSLMQSVMMYTKIQQNIKRKHNLLLQLEDVTQQIATVEYIKNCIIVEDNPNHVIELLRHNAGCGFAKNEQKYIYLINDLGVSPCLNVIFRNEKVSGHLWLISVVSISFPQIILQLRLVKPYSKLLTCDAQTRLVNYGVISWRYIN